MTSTAIETDISVLVGQMPDIPCEHSQHGKPGAAHDDGPATHYIQSFCNDCYIEPTVLAACQAFTNLELQDLNVHCTSCRRITPASQGLKILGPVGASR